MAVVFAAPANKFAGARHTDLGPAVIWIVRFTVRTCRRRFGGPGSVLLLVPLRTILTNFFQIIIFRSDTGHATKVVQVNR
jgi:hypothetical protein